VLAVAWFPARHCRHRVRPIGRGHRVPRHLIRRRRVFRPEVRAIELELHPGNAAVIRGRGRHRHHQSHAARRGRTGHRHGGAVVSFATVTLTLLAVDTLPAPSRATAVTVYVPFGTFIVFHHRS